MNLFNGYKTYLLAAAYGVGYGFVQSGGLNGIEAIDWSMYFAYMFEGGFAAVFRSALNKVGNR